MDFYIILSRIGEFGKFQYLLCAYTFFVAFIMTFPHMSQIIITITPDHWCRTPNLENLDIELTDLEQRYLMIPVLGDNHILEHDKCRMFDVNISRTTNILTSADNVSLSDISSAHNQRQSIKCRHGWTFDKSVPYNSLVTQKEWICEHSWNDMILQMSFWAGTALGPLFFGPLVDAFGRRPVIMILYSTAAISGLLTAVVSNKFSIFAARFLAGVPLNIMCSTPYILVIEYVAPVKRGLMTFIFCVTMSASWALFSLLAYFIGDWRIFLFFTSPLLFVIVALTWLLPESLTWMMIHKKTDRAIRTIQWIAKINDKAVSSDFIDKFQESVDLNISATYSYKDMFRTKGMRKLVFLISVIWTIVCCSYTGAIYATVALNNNPFISIVLGSVLEGLAPVFQLLLCDRIGRRWTCSISSMLCSLAFFLSCVFVNGNYWAFISLIIVARVAASTAFNTTGMFSAELFPSGIRARCIAFRQIIGTLGTFLSSYIIYLRMYSKLIPLLVMAFLMFVEAFLYLMLPETMNRKLCNQLSEIDEMVEKHSLFGAKLCLLPTRGGSKPVTAKDLEQEFVEI